MPSSFYSLKWNQVKGGLGFSEAQNGRIFALIGILGIVTQGGLIDLLLENMVRSSSFDLVQFFQELAWSSSPTRVLTLCGLG